MEGNECNTNLNPFYHQQQGLSLNNNNNGVGVFMNNPNANSSSSTYPDGGTLLFPHSLRASPPSSSSPSAVAAVPELVRRKRGRPRKYGPAGAPSGGGVDGAGNVKASSLAGLPVSSSSRSAMAKKEPGSGRKAQMVALGNAGQQFMPHVITVASGEDVFKKIITFTQQRQRAVCILSANGSISNATLRQSSMTGGTITYEGRFEILSLSGTFLHMEFAGAPARPGGLTICLSAADGRIVGGSVGGSLIAASLVQVILGSFLMDSNKDHNVGKMDTVNQQPMPAVITPANFRQIPEPVLSKATGRGSMEHHHMAGSGFLHPSFSMHMLSSRSTDWRSHLESQGRNQNDRSPDEVDDDQMDD